MTRLVTVVGLPRSGTSWLGKIFDSHPDTAYRSEPDNFPSLEGVPLFPAPGSAESFRIDIAKFVDDLPRLRSYRCAAKPPSFPKSYRGLLRSHLFRYGAAVARVGHRLDLDIPVPGARVDRAPPPMLVWKSIRSLGRIDLLVNSLPEVRIVHLIRHPCGHVGSVLRGARHADFPANTSEYYGIFSQLLETPQGRRTGLTLAKLKQLAPEERLAWHWVLVNEKAVEESVGQDRVHLVRYEDICANPVAAAQDLFRFAGIEWQAQTETFVRQSISGNNERYFSVMKDPSESANRWRREMSADCIDRIMRVLRSSTVLSKLYGVEQGAALA